MANPQYPSTPITQRRWDFGGSVLPELWSTVSLGSGMAVSVTGNCLQVTTGVAANSETLVRCTQPLRIKVLAKLILWISQRIANQSFNIELMNAAGTSGVIASFDSAAQDTVKLTNKNAGTYSDSVAISLPVNTTSAMTYLLGVENDISYLEATLVNSPDARYYSAMLERYIPDSDELLYLQIRITNGATAPASTTTFYLDSVCIDDVQHTPVDFGNLLGSAATANSLPVRPVGNVTIQPNIAAYAESTTPLAAAGVFTGLGHECQASAGTKAMVFINSDVACTYEFQQSVDNTTFFTTNTAALTANQFFNIEENLVLKYWRVKVTNGASAQSSFKCYTRQRC